MNIEKNQKVETKPRRDNIVSLAEKHCQIDDRGFGRILEIYADDYPSDLPSSNNGYGDFKYSSPLARKYIIRKFYANGTVKLVTMGRHVSHHSKDLVSPLDKRGQKGNTLIAWQIYGFAPDDSKTKSSIPKVVRKFFSGGRCAFTGSQREIEVDHKHGREDQDLYPSGSALSDPENYQCATKEQNDAKREHCLKCRASDRRFDAKTLDYNVGWVEGSEKFQPTREGCRGCYLFDPKAFRSALVRGRRKP